MEALGRDITGIWGEARACIRQAYPFLEDRGNEDAIFLVATKVSREINREMNDITDAVKGQLRERGNGGEVRSPAHI